MNQQVNREEKGGVGAGTPGSGHGLLDPRAVAAGSPGMHFPGRSELAGGTNGYQRARVGGEAHGPTAFVHPRPTTGYGDWEESWAIRCSIVPAHELARGAPPQRAGRTFFSTIEFSPSQA